MSKNISVSVVSATQHTQGIFSREQDPLDPNNKMTVVTIILKTDLSTDPAGSFVPHVYILESGRFVDKNNVTLVLPNGTLAQFKQNLAFLRDQAVLDEGY